MRNCAAETTVRGYSCATGASQVLGDGRPIREHGVARTALPAERDECFGSARARPRRRHDAPLIDERAATRGRIAMEVAMRTPGSGRSTARQGLKRRYPFEIKPRAQ